MSKILAPTFDDFIAHLGNNESLLAALTQAVHRFYYDECFDPYTQRPFNDETVKFVNELHNDLWLQSPGWRDTIKRIAKRYLVENASVKWLPLNNTPEIDLVIK